MLSVPDENCSGNGSCALKLDTTSSIYIFLFLIYSIYIFADIVLFIRHSLLWIVVDEAIRYNLREYLYSCMAFMQYWQHFLSQKMLIHCIFIPNTTHINILCCKVLHHCLVLGDKYLSKHKIEFFLFKCYVNIDNTKSGVFQYEIKLEIPILK